MELKTLKDLKVSSKNPMFNMGSDTQREVLKAEAIKWIKKLKIKKLEYDEIGYVDLVWMGGDSTQPKEDAYEQCEGAIAILKKIYNIKKEELK